MTKEEKAVYKTLIVSASRGLNANLSPDDCRILLKMLIPRSISDRRRKTPAVDRIIQNVSSIFTNTLEDLADDIEEIRDECFPRGRKE